MKKRPICMCCGEPRKGLGRRAMVLTYGGPARGGIVCRTCAKRGVLFVSPPPLQVPTSCKGCRHELAEYGASCVERVGGHIAELTAANVALRSADRLKKFASTHTAEEPPSAADAGEEDEAHEGPPPSSPRYSGDDSREPPRVKTRDRAERMANAIAIDIALYNLDAVERARAAGKLAAGGEQLEEAIREGRALYHARLMPGAIPEAESILDTALEHQLLGSAHPLPLARRGGSA